MTYQAVVGVDGDAEAMGEHVFERVVLERVPQLRHGLAVRRQAHLRHKTDGRQWTDI